MAKRITKKERDEIIKSFQRGKTIDEISKEFNFSKLTISRNLKKDLGINAYREIKEKNKISKKTFLKKDYDDLTGIKKEFEKKGSTRISIQDEFNEKQYQKEFYQDPEFMEIAPLDYEIDQENRKDLTSIPISEVSLPSIVYMIVDNKIELQTKILKEYPAWNFLSENELSRKTIEIYEDKNFAKRNCTKQQKVIKVPNTNVFRIVAPILLSRGISRIVSPNQLIAL